MSEHVQWDAERGRYVNLALEAVQERHRLAGVFSRCILGGGDLAAVVTITLEQTPATHTAIVAALVQAAQDAAHNGDAEEEPVGREVAALLSMWLAQAVRQQ